jgi:glutathione S-transferase
MLTIWGRQTSSKAQALMWCVGELGLAYERIDIGHRFGSNDTPEFLAMNPNGTVPVVHDGDGPPMWETGAILRALCQRHGNDPFWPSDQDASTTVDMWAEWAKINVTLGFTAPVFWRVVRTAPDKRDAGSIKAAVESLAKRLEIAEKRLASRAFLTSDDFTLADIQFGHVLYRYYDIDIERAELPGLRAYFDLLTAQTAYREHVMVSYDELRVS